MTLRTALLLAVLALARSAAAATTLQMKHDQWQSTTVLQGNKLRVETEPSAGAPTVMIFDGDAGKMISLDTQAKTYTERTPASMRAELDASRQAYKDRLAAMSPEQKQKMDEMLAKMPEAQRRKMQQMLDGSAAETPLAPSTWEKTGTTVKVAGFRCEGFREQRAGKPVAEGCFIPWSEGAVSKSDLGAMRKMADFVKAGMGNAAMTDSALTELEKLPGFPGEWATIDETGKPGLKSVLTAVQHGAAPAGSFAPPAGFSKVDRPLPQGRAPRLPR